MDTYLDLPKTGSDISGETTFDFINPSGSAYFVLETITTSSIYDGASPKNFNGTFTSSSVSGIVSSPYQVGIVVPPGSSSFNFTPDNAVVGSTYIIRGTGMFSFSIS